MQQALLWAVASTYTKARRRSISYEYGHRRFEHAGSALAAVRADGVIDKLLSKYGMPASAKLD